MAHSSRHNGLMHLKGDILCAIDVETSGTVPGFHDLLQICVLPLDYKLDVWKEKTPFYMEIKPKRPENYGLKSEWRDEQEKKKNKQLMAHATVSGMDPYQAADFFDEWFQKLNLGFEKRIAPLAHNWPFDRAFILDWLGPESFSQFFDARYRDTMVTANFINDQADVRLEPYIFNKVSLGWLASVYYIDHPRAHDALEDCYVTSQVYKKMVYGF